MKFAAFFTPRYKWIIHFLVFVPALSSIFYTTIQQIDSNEMNAADLMADVYPSLLFLLTIFCMAFSIIPQLLKGTKKGFFSLFGFSFVFTALLVYFRTKAILVSPSEFSQNYLDPKLILYSVLTLISLGIISFIYSSSILEHQWLKNIFLTKNLESALNSAAVGIVLISFFFINPDVRGVDFMLLISYILIFYTHAFYISPLLVKLKKVGAYLGCLALLVGIYYLTFSVLLSFTSTGFFVAFSRFVLSLGNGFVLLALLTSSFIYAYVRYKIKGKETALTQELDTKNTELQLLKSQVNPHFLFNTLNTLYATALEEKAEKTGESIAKLASLLRYMQNDIHKEAIPLQQELRYIKDYIAIQRLRYSFPIAVHTNFEHIENQMISPGVLIPFVENAFKYGIDPRTESEIEIAVVCDSDTIFFSCTNSFTDNPKPHIVEKGFGIGIKNTRERLRLTYPKQHKLTISQENHIFSVELKLQYHTL